MKSFSSVLKKFLYLFFIQLSVFLCAGILLLVLSSKYEMCKAFGCAFITFDFIASVIESIKYAKRPTVNSSDDIDHISESDFDAKFMVDEKSEEVGQNVTQSLMDRLLGENPTFKNDVWCSPDKQGEALLEFLEERINIDTPFSECIDAFEEMCNIPLEESRVDFEAGALFINNENFYFSVIRFYRGEDGRLYKIRLEFFFEIEKANKRIFEMDSTKYSGIKFFEALRKSKAYKYSSNNKFFDYDIKVSYEKEK